jgi:16S rRNA C1402 (ribose-2'-O) methylase RsmI
MVPLKDMNAHKAFSDLKVAHERVDHVDIVYNAGHPGVAEPHYHFIVWYVSAQRAAQLVK